MNNNLHQSALWSGGLVAVGLVVLQGFLSLSSLDIAAYISIVAFALAIPILTCNTLVKLAKAREGIIVRDTRREILFYILGMAAALVGVAAAFWHICWIAAVVFLLSTLVALPVCLLSLPYKKRASVMD